MINTLRFLSTRSLPVIQQSEAAECGLACVAMVASYHGHRLDLHTLRQRHSLSLKGADLVQIMNVASALELIPRPLKLESSGIDQLVLPAILHWDMNHFVVLKSVSSNGVRIHCPARGALTLTREEVDQHFTGIALELRPSDGFEKKDERSPLSLWSLIPPLTGMKALIAQILVVSLVLQGLALLSPYMIMIVTDTALATDDSSMLTVIGIGFLLLALLTTIAEVFRSWLLLYFSKTLNFQMAARLFRHMIYLPHHFFTQRHVGDIQSRFSSMESVNETITGSVLAALIDGGMVVITLGLLFSYSQTLAFIIAGATLVYALVRVVSFNVLRRRSEAEIMESAKVDTNFLETVRGNQSIKIMRGERDREVGWQNRTADAINSEINVNRLEIWLNGVNSLLFGVVNVVVIWIGAALIMQGELTIGVLMAITMWKGNFEEKAASFIEAVIQIVLLGLHRDRIADIALTETENIGTDSGKAIDISGQIDVSGLSYSYSEMDAPVLSELSFSIRPGESVALTGPSGCGKSTLMKALIGLVEPTDGEVRIDGHPIPQLGLGHYRDRIGVVMQDDQLFSGTLRDNITFFSTAPDDARIKHAAAIAAIDDDIAAMPMGYDTLIGDMGTVLSGGQKQRVLIARALYRNPRILFLDEATSHLDNALERRVSDNIAALGITRVMIAHRKETIASADRVIELLDLQGERLSA
ncbi:peptidase domain-containing ABC transporter [Marinobacter sp. C2H3]|uniref:peptidase domain-containing ABC transporter n=1 Tax=Marinobacter sp. C2H3 TaxID=3119003 RepID=UPI00300F356D